MAEVKWIKIATDMFDNRKIRQLESLPDGDTIVVIWLKILCLAGNVNERGYIYFTKEVPYTEEMLATQFNRPLSTIRLALQMFESFNMIEIIDDVVKISNWEKYQNIEGLEKVKEQNRIRKQKQREKEKQELLPEVSRDSHRECHGMSRDSHVTVTENVTHGHATDIDIDKELEKEKDKDKELDKESISCVTETVKPKSKDDYPDHYQKFWEAYPRHTEKKNAYKKYNARLKEGYTPDQLLAAAENYATECRQQGRDGKYIKMGATFLSETKPFEDYIEGVPAVEGYNNNVNSESRTDFIKRLYREAQAEEQGINAEFEVMDFD